MASHEESGPASRSEAKDFGPASSSDPAIPLGPGREFGRIRTFLKDLPPAEGVSVGPGDDAAVLDGGLVLSTDMAVEGVHFRFDWVTAHEAGFRAVAAALSDLAAMAARPLGVLVSLAVPPRPSGRSSEVMAGCRERLDGLGIPLIGGDLTRSPGPVVLDVVVVGRADRPLLRTGARQGDELWVTGRLGGAAAAVSRWTEGREPSPALRNAFARPTPRLAEARYLVEVLGATAGLDLSDGLAGDAGHLAAASGVGVVIDAWRVPLHPDLEPDSESPMGLHGGEDFELLVSLPGGISEPEVEKFQERFDLTLTRIGTVDGHGGVRIRRAPETEPEPVERGGWDHFLVDEEREEA